MDPWMVVVTFLELMAVVVIGFVMYKRGWL